VAGFGEVADWLNPAVLKMPAANLDKSSQVSFERAGAHQSILIKPYRVLFGEKNRFSHGGLPQESTQTTTAVAVVAVLVKRPGT
jgi:hypothetical protein